jgi:hypothetical protein
MDNAGRHLCGHIKGTREDYVFKCEELEEVRGRTIMRDGFVRGFEELVRMEKGMDLFREFVKETKVRMVGWLEEFEPR